jgi:hypothetical protein
MFDAVNAASGSPYPPIAYGGGSVTGADPNAGALQAALTVMNSLYGPTSLYQQYAGVTGATYYPSIPGYAGTLVGSTTVQVGAEFSRVFGSIHTPAAVTQALALGNAIGNYTFPLSLPGKAATVIFAASSRAI